ncbi:B3 domain-containing protein Os04g0386900-like [Phragmites australis]|uniref:B3 domain-containing protein Os04g0386900-like n=1 Tax=Phragmites australis TaxID=29695 RepID=UPI002D79607F|nr:B3 domain-containing protein Os04g0386900-like [Phragmites australis]
MPSDSNTANLSSRESRSVAGTKGKAVVNSAEKSGEAIDGTPARPDLRSVSVSVSVSEKMCIEKIQPRILPLLGKPYFACIICKSHVQLPFQVVVPKSLAPFLPSASAPATLTWRGRSWEMRFTGGRQIRRLEAGWRAFALDNDLRLGDGCVFELVDSAAEGGAVAFRVQHLRADIPAAIRERAGGYTSSSPIVID